MVSSITRRDWILQVATYNAQAATTLDRWDDIAHTLHADIIAVQGTQRIMESDRQSRAVFGKEDMQSVEQFRIEDYHVFHWGVQQVKYANKACGVAIMLRDKTFPRCSVRAVFPPPKELQGRGGALRLRCGYLDLTPVVAYLPVEPHVEKDKEAVKCWYMWCNQLVGKLPARTMCCLLGDFNAHLGSICACQWPSFVGSASPQHENFNGFMLRRFLEEHDMLAVNTWHQFDSGFTFYNGKSSSRVDFVCVPLSYAHNVLSCYVWRHAGLLLQRNGLPFLIDHCPVVLRIKLKQVFASKPKQVYWNFELQKRELHQQLEAFRFLVNAWRGSSECQSQFHELLSKRRIAEAWHLLSNGLINIAFPLFTVRGRALKVQNVAAKQFRESSRYHLSACCDLIASDMYFWNLLQFCFLAWYRLAFSARANRNYHKEKVKALRAFFSDLVAQMSEAWNENDHKRFWRIARQLGNSKYGPKKRAYGAVTDSPSSDEWKVFLCLPGAEGGFSAHQLREPAQTFAWTDDGTFVSETDLPSLNQWLSADSMCCPPDTLSGAISQDTHRFVTALANTKSFRQCPDWSLPPFLWKQLILQHPCDQVSLDLFDLLACVRECAVAPWQWHHSQVSFIPKGNGKPGIPGIRLIHKLDTIGKAYYDVLWSYRDIKYYDFACGYCKFRRREQAILQQRVLQERLCAFKHSFVFTLYDVRNAFPSITHQTLTNYVNAVCPVSDHALLKQRFLQARMTMKLDERWVTFALGAGTMPGDRIAGSMFAEPYNQILNNCFCEAKHQNNRFLQDVRDPISGVSVDLSATVYADDVARLEVISDDKAIADRQFRLDQIFQKWLQPHGLHMHPGKKRLLIHLCGGHVNARRNAITSPTSSLYGITQPNVVYLGATFTDNGSLNSEVSARVAAARRAWYMLKRIWTFRELDISKRLHLFRRAVETTLLSGLVTAPLLKSQINRLESWRMQKIWTIVRRHSLFRTVEQPNLPARYTSLPYDEIRRRFSLPTLQSILDVSVLRWIKAMATHPEHYVALRASLFGTLGSFTDSPIDQHGALTSFASSWLFWVRDCCVELHRVNPAFPDIITLPNGFLQLFSPDSPLLLPEARIYMLLTPTRDVSVQTATYSTAECPTCHALFSSRVACACHRRIVHQDGREHSWTVVTNQCPYCGRVLSSVRAVRDHLTRLKDGICPKPGGHCKSTSLQEVLEPQCANCGKVFNGLHNYNQHIRTQECLAQV